MYGSRADHPWNWLDAIKISGLDNATSELEAYKKNIRIVMVEINNARIKKDSLQTDFQQVVGNNSLSVLEGAIEKYINNIQILKRVGITDQDVIAIALQGPVQEAKQERANFDWWRATISRRYYEARSALEKFL